MAIQQRIRPKPSPDWLMFSALTSAALHDTDPKDAAIHVVDLDDKAKLVLAWPDGTVLDMPPERAAMVHEAAERLAAGELPHIQLR